jgi:hypothetical protein
MARNPTKPRLFVPEAFAIATLSLLAAAIVPGPASAAQTFTWELSCDGNGGGAYVAWDWLIDGVAIEGAAGSASCLQTSSANGSAERPSSANGFTARIAVSAGGTVKDNTATKTFAEGKEFKTQVGVALTVSDHCGGKQSTGPPCIELQAKESGLFKVNA